MPGDRGKAEVIPYESLFPREEAQRAARRVEDEISEHRRQLDLLRLFAADNVDLVNLVHRLPDELSHDIMVPFGKAAFFPGRLVHTNEFMVLLGEGYFAEQTAKQTTGVLKRRGQVLESKIEALNTTIADLKARAEFFGVTAGNSAEGIVEIREFEETQQDKNDNAGLPNSASLISLKDGKVKQTVTDEEYARILSGLDELEKAELAAESVSSDKEDDRNAAESFHSMTVHSTDDHKTILGQKFEGAEQPPKDLDPSYSRTARLSELQSQEDISVHSSLINRSHQAHIDGKKPTGSDLGTKDTSSFKSAHSTERSPLPTSDKGKLQEEYAPINKTFTGNIVERCDDVESSFSNHSSPQNSGKETPMFGYNNQKAFTGTIIERSDGLESSLSSRSSSQTAQGTTKPSKPVSRFKLQKGR